MQQSDSSTFHPLSVMACFKRRTPVPATPALIEKVLAMLQCGVCAKPISGPVLSLGCEHHFCKACIDSQPDGRASCLACRVTCNASEVCEMRGLLKLIAKQEMKQPPPPPHPTQPIDSPHPPQSLPRKQARKQQLPGPVKQSKLFKDIFGRLADIEEKIGIQCSLYLQKLPGQLLTPQIQARHVLISKITVPVRLLAVYVLRQLGLDEEGLPQIALWVRIDQDYARLQLSSTIKEVVLRQWPSARCELEAFKGGIDGAEGLRTVFYSLSFTQV